MKASGTFIIVALLLSLASCDRDGVFDVEKPDIRTDTVGHDLIVLGEKLEDPYTVENMRRSYASLYPTRSDRDAVVTSDLYVRFLPEGDSDYKRLERLGLELVDHPVDYQIVRDGDYYHDPSLSDDKITWQYAVVPSTFMFPNDIKFEILDECFIPENVPTRATDIDWEAVERESYRLTGNEIVSTRSESGAPSGRLMVYDDKLKQSVGLAGVKVVVNSFVKICTAYTDKDGNYEMDRNYSSQVRYRIVFKNKRGFGIGVNLLLIPASISTLGKDDPSGKTVTISSSSERKLFCRSVVNNAAYDYYQMCNEDGSDISVPAANLRFWIFQKMRSSAAPMLQQGVSIVDNLLGKWLGEYASLLKAFFPDIVLGVSDLDDYASIYELAWHELAHASHYEQAGSEYWSEYAKFIVTSFVTSGGITYGTGSESGAGYCEVGEMWAYFMESRLAASKYDAEDFAAGTSYWFHPQIFLYLYDRGLSEGDIFRALTSDVHDRDDLRSELLSLHPSYRTAVRQAFERYK